MLRKIIVRRQPPRPGGGGILAQLAQKAQHVRNAGGPLRRHVGPAGLNWAIPFYIRSRPWAPTCP